MTDHLDALKSARRIRVIGISGAGKSTLARALADTLDLPVIHMDVEFWQPGWVEPDEDVWQEKIAKLTLQDRWIMDGNFGSSMHLTLPPADVIIHLTCSRLAAIWGISVRRFKRDWRSRSDLAEGCQEQFDPDFFRYVWRFNAGSLPQIRERVATFAAEKPSIELYSRRAVTAFLRDLQDRS